MAGAKTKGYIQNLETMQLRKFVFNPEEYDYGYGIEFAELKGPGLSHPLYQFVGGQGRDLSFQLLFDAREWRDGRNPVLEWQDFLGKFHPIYGNKKMDYNPPPMALVSMGSFTRKVIITDIRFKIILMDKNLVPTRATADLTMQVLA